MASSKSGSTKIFVLSPFVDINKSLNFVIPPPAKEQPNPLQYSQEIRKQTKKKTLEPEVQRTSDLQPEPAGFVMVCTSEDCDRAKHAQVDDQGPNGAA